MSGPLVLCPICAECNWRWPGDRPQRAAKIETWPRLAGHGKLERLTDAAKDVAFGDAASVAFIDSRPKCGKLRFVLLFLALQGPQTGAHDFTGVFVTPALNLFGDEVVKLVGQIHVPGRHGGPFDRRNFEPIIARLAKIANHKPTKVTLVSLPTQRYPAPKGSFSSGSA